VESDRRLAAGVPPAAGGAVAFLAGFGCMAAELTAVRLLAPHFGDSAYVWTNVIGVILAALAVGAWLGGRAASRAAVHAVVAWICLFAGVAIAGAPWIAQPLGAWLVPGDLPLDAAMPSMIRGSLAATLALFAPAMVALGALSPLLVTGIVRRGGDVGRASGAVAAAGTLGSLVGTFAATHWPPPHDQPRLRRGPGRVLPPGMTVQVAPVEPAFAYDHRSFIPIPPPGVPPNM
jgi:hypothetical protein